MPALDCVGGETLTVEPQRIFEEQYGDTGCEQEPYFSADALKGESQTITAITACHRDAHKMFGEKSLA